MYIMALFALSFLPPFPFCRILISESSHKPTSIKQTKNQMTMRPSLKCALVWGAVACIATANPVSRQLLVRPDSKLNDTAPVRSSPKRLRKNMN